MDLKELAVLTNQLVKKAASEDDESFLYQYRVPISLIAGGLAGAALGTKYAPFLKRKLGKILQFGKTKAKSKTRKAKTRTGTKAKSKTGTQGKREKGTKAKAKGGKFPLKAFLGKKVPNWGITYLELLGVLAAKRSAFPKLVERQYLTKRQAKKIAKAWDILREKGKLEKLPKYEDVISKIKVRGARKLLKNTRPSRTPYKPLVY